MPVKYFLLNDHQAPLAGHQVVVERDQAVIGPDRGTATRHMTVTEYPGLVHPTFASGALIGTRDAAPIDDEDGHQSANML